MIRYALLCEHDHEFESWFDSSNAYDKLQKAGMVECPHCGSHKTRKALMTPQIGSRKTKTPLARKSEKELQKVQKQMVDMARKVRRHIEKNAEHVGDRFAVEARKIHNEESEPRNIYGKATREEVTDLVKDGIDITPLPDLPEDKN